MRQLASHLGQSPGVNGLPHLHLLQQLFGSDYAQELEELLHFCRGDLQALSRALLVAYLELQLQANQDQVVWEPDKESLHTSLHHFQGNIRQICLQQTTGALSSQDAYQAIRQQWKQLKAKRKALRHQGKDSNA